MPKHLLQLGGHVSTAGGLYRCIENAERIGANTIQIFASSSRQWKTKFPSEEELKQYRDAIEGSVLKSVYLHAPYLVNIATFNDDIYQKSVQNLTDHLNIAEQLSANGLIFHIGSRGEHLSFDDAIDRIVKAMKEVLKNVQGNTQLVMENAAGAGTKVGSTASELGILMKRIGSSRVKVCFDTAHAFEAGLIPEYSCVNIQQLLQEWDTEIGLKNIVALHINDSKSAFNSHYDRHENLGEGYIGLAGFKNLALEKRLWDKAWILEVPGFDDTGPDEKNMELLKTCFSDTVELRN